MKGHIASNIKSLLSKFLNCLNTAKYIEGPDLKGLFLCGSLTVAVRLFNNFLNFLADQRLKFGFM